MLNKYSHEQLSDDPRHFRHLFIDSTMIKNISGCDCVGRNPSDRGRLATKISIICDKNMIPVSCTEWPANVSDIKTLEKSVNNMSCPIKKDNRFKNYVIGDKGYVSKALTELLAKSKIIKLTPHRKNSKKVKKMDKDDKERLRERDTR
jgi:hypothetical protein